MSLLTVFIPIPFIDPLNPRPKRLGFFDFIHKTNKKYKKVKKNLCE